MYILVKTKNDDDDNGFKEIDYIIDYSETIDKFKYKLNTFQYDMLMNYDGVVGIYRDNEVLIFTPKLSNNFKIQ